MGRPARNFLFLSCRARTLTIVHLLLIAIATAYGAVAGLLLARPAYRLSVEPEQPWQAACPSGHVLSGPLRGWFGTARCPECHGSAGFGGPVGSFVPLTAVCCALVAATVGERPELVVWLLVVPPMVLLAAVDQAVQRLPDIITLPLAAAVPVGLGIAALLPGASGSWLRALLGGVALGGGYFALFLINPRGMGFGDVKLALTIGTALGWYGWAVILVGTLIGFLLAAGFGLWLILARRAGRKTALPFGPFMALGGLTALLLGGLAA